MTDIRVEQAILLGEIQTLAHMVNSCTEYCVFVRYSGHISSFEVSIAKSKNDYNTKLVRGEGYTEPRKRLTDDKRLGEFRRIKAELRKILRKGKIDYSRLNYEIEEVRHYHFNSGE